MMDNKLSDKLFYFLLFTGIALNFNGLLNDILEPDGALYATIAKHIALTGDWINLWGDGHDWLDKPHLPFWLCAASFKILGINAFAYKFPAFIFWLGGILFTFKLAKKLYNTSIARVSALIYVFALHTTLNNFDVRAEPFLTTLSIAAIYYFYKAHLSGKLIHIVAAALCSACAIMTKGLFILITIASGFIIWWVVSKQYKQFINYKWYLLLLITGGFIIPELYCLYSQFDMHPEKIVFGKNNVSGIQFFLWDSQFGRFFNTGPIKGSGDKTFFLHTTLWAFLPWSIVLYAAVIKLIRNKTGNEPPQQERWIIYGSALVTFVLFSFSGFQLPHYITLLFPQFSIITAAYLLNIKKEKSIKTLHVIQLVLFILSAIAISLLSYYAKFGFSYLLLAVLWIIAFILIILLKKASINNVVKLGCAISMILFVYLFNFFYPSLLQYQSGMLAGRWLQQNKPTSNCALFSSFSYSFEFYAPGIVETIKDKKQLDAFLQQSKNPVLYTTVNNMQYLKDEGYSFKLLNEYSYFAVSMLNATFLQPSTRDMELEKMCILEIVR